MNLLFFLIFRGWGWFFWLIFIHRRTRGTWKWTLWEWGVWITRCAIFWEVLLLLKSSKRLQLITDNTRNTHDKMNYHFKFVLVWQIGVFLATFSLDVTAFGSNVVFSLAFRATDRLLRDSPDSMSLYWEDYRVSFSWSRSWDKCECDSNNRVWWCIWKHTYTRMFPFFGLFHGIRILGNL